MKVIVRNITPSDYRQAIRAVKRSHRISFGKIYPKKLIDAFCRKYNYGSFLRRVRKIDYFVVEDIDTRKILGTIGLDHDELRSFFVDPDYQGMGVGRKLYDYLEKEARRRGLKEIILDSSPLGEPVYKHFGFMKIKLLEKERVGIKYTDAFMKKVLE